MEITKREIVASISIIAIMLIVGMMISGKISDYNIDKNEKYNKALKISDEELFKYSMNTNVGNAFVYGDLEAIDSVSFPEIDGEYLSVEKVKEKYTRHTRIVTTTDSKGKTKTKTEVYWTWDVINREKLVANEVNFLGINFNTSQFAIPSNSHITTIKESSKIRYKYYGYPKKSTGTMFSYLSDSNIENENVSFYEDKTIEETLDYLNSNISSMVFWAIWIILICGSVYGFYYAENNWLNK